MSTNSTIIVQHPSKLEWASVYCHWDGYPAHNGRLLLHNYTTYEKVYQLIQLGSISSLEETADSTEDYHRMRGEDVEINIHPELARHCDQEYCYLFKDGKWFWKRGYNQGVFRELTEKDVLK